MGIKISVECESIEEYMEFSAKLVAGYAGKTLTPPPGFPPIPQDGVKFPAETAKEKVKSAAQKAGLAVPKEESAPSISEDTQTSENPPAPSSDGALEYKTVSDLVLKLVANKDKGGKTKAVEILGKHGVTSGRELKPEQYPGVVADFEAALA